MSLIDYTHFIADFNVGQLSAVDVKANLQQYIDLYEAEYIIKLLGEDFSAIFNASEDNRFDVLQGKLTTKPSPIAGYVFWNYQKGMAIKASGSGDIRPSAENATRSPESYRMRIAWNIMVEKSRAIVNYLCKNTELYPEFKLCEVDRTLLTKQNDFGI